MTYVTQRVKEANESKRKIKEFLTTSAVLH